MTTHSSIIEYVNVKNEDCFESPIRNNMAERLKFYKRSQRQNESITDYIIQLKDLVQKCEFGKCTEIALRDQFVCGLSNECTQKNLLTETTLTFKQACSIALEEEQQSQFFTFPGHNNNPSIISRSIRSSQRKVRSRDLFPKVELEIKKEITECDNKNIEKAKPDDTGSYDACDVCGKLFKNLYSLKNHKIKHTEEKPFTCDKCGKTFKTLKYLQRHGVIHSEERPYKCLECGNKFKRIDDLKKHQVTHSEVTSFKCEKCGKMFKAHNNLAMHLKTHTELKNVKCEICGKTFKLLSYLKTHLKLRHSDKRAFACDKCGNMFKQLCTLKNHLLTKHSDLKPFTCEVCGKAFKQTYNLKSHLLTHSKAKVIHTCEDCGKTFISMGNLTQHMKIHSKSKVNLEIGHMYK